MKVTLLLENNSLFNRYHNAEHGYSAWIEDEDVKVLYDCGYSDKFLKNAEELGIDVRTADYVVISHGHFDHSGGLKYLIKYYRDNAMFRKPFLLFAHEDIMLPKYEFNWNKKLGIDVDLEVLKQYFNIIVSAKPIWVTKNLCFMGLTEISNDFEREFPQTPKIYKGEKWVDDFVDEDTQFCYKHKNGQEVSIVAACAHYGICNIMEYAKKLTGAKKVHTYLGGSHMRKEEISDRQLKKTCEYVRKEAIKNFHICHDTDLECKLALANASPIKEAGVGLVVECD
jgi:7,8-dihydropterin-6-yl-methyl-4-(beta-D-ribofuranosyl)aminobenzene 5'-phosphate synthase